MRGTRFQIEGTSIAGVSDQTWLDDELGWPASLRECVLQDLGTEVNITISGVTMFLAAWEDPEHWSSDWAKKLGVDPDGVPDAVEELVAEAQEES